MDDAPQATQKLYPAHHQDDEEISDAVRSRKGNASPGKAISDLMAWSRATCGSARIKDEAAKQLCI